MGNGSSRVTGCFAAANGKDGVDLDFLEPLDEGLGHSFCYVRPGVIDSPSITPSISERFTLDLITSDSERQSSSFRQEVVDDTSGLHRSNKNFPETTFRTISGASVSANVSTARSLNPCASYPAGIQEPNASFESTSSFSAIPLQPMPRGSGPLNGFMSGPLERGFSSGPLEKGVVGFMSGPIEKGVFMSGPLEATDKTNFSAPLFYVRRKEGFGRVVKNASRPIKTAIARTFSKPLLGSHWIRRVILNPITRFKWHSDQEKFQTEVPHNAFDVGPSKGKNSEACNLQWAHGKAGEDRVHVVLSEEQGWLFVGIYDGFSGPDAPDFLMSNLYRAIDKELEGLLWDFHDNSISSRLNSHGVETDNVLELSDDRKEGTSHACEIAAASDFKLVIGQTSDQLRPSEIHRNVHDINRDRNLCSEGTYIIPTCPDTGEKSILASDLSGQGRSSRRLYELLQMESDNACLFSSESDVDSRRVVKWHLQPTSHALNSMGSSNSYQEREKNFGEIMGTLDEESKQDSLPSHSTRRSIIGSKLRRMYKRKKYLQEKLFAWRYDWNGEKLHAAQRIVRSLEPPSRRFKFGPIDHAAVLEAMSRALQSTEAAYMDMVDEALDKNAELALMGSCVLVMLMKDQDVYVMNLGDSRVILAQERTTDHCTYSNHGKDDGRNINRSRESLVRVELDQISEESLINHEQNHLGKCKGREIYSYGLKIRAIQLSTDHSTSVEEEVLRIKAEHVNDEQAILNDRVKGQLKVTRAFGAGFLKKPECNAALLEVFRIDYIGTSPYLSCIPSLLHHRLSSNDRFLVLSSDGLYQYFSNEEVVSHVARFMENAPEGDPAQYLIAELLCRAAKKNGMNFHELLDIPHGDRRKYHDDISVMVISLEGRIWRSPG